MPVTQQKEETIKSAAINIFMLHEGAKLKY